METKIGKVEEDETEQQQKIQRTMYYTQFIERIPVPYIHIH